MNKTDPNGSPPAEPGEGDDSTAKDEAQSTAKTEADSVGSGTPDSAGKEQADPASQAGGSGGPHAAKQADSIREVDRDALPHLSARSGTASAGRTGRGGRDGSGSGNPRSLASTTALILLGAGLLFGAAWLYTGSFPFMRRAVSTVGVDVPPGLVLAHVADPRIGVDSAAVRSNASVLADALRSLRARPGVPAPELIVVTGELSPLPPDSAATAADSTIARRTREEFNRLAGLLATGPSTVAFLSGGTAVRPEWLAQARALMDSAGVVVHDLMACTTDALEPCDVGTHYRLVVMPGLMQDSTPNARVIADADSAVSRAGREDRYVILVPANLLGTDPESMKSSAAWTNLTSREGVAAVLARPGAGVAVPAWKFVRTPPLGAARAGPPTRRGLAVVHLLEGVPRVETLLLDQSFQRAPPAESEPTRMSGTTARLFALGGSMGEPGRTAVFWIALLTAFLTVAALWKVPDTVIGTTMAVTDSTQSAGGAGTSATGSGSQVTTTVTTADETSPLKTNLAKTVVSGLTGIAAVTILKDVWGISGTAGQAWFAIIFIISFFILLFASAFLRALIEAARERVSVDRHIVLKAGTSVGLPRRVVVWLGSYRTTVLVFLDTFLSVLFGHGPQQLLVWEGRFTELQETLVESVDRVREQLSDCVGDALREAGISDARAERDYRVNISLLASDGGRSFYISAARLALPKVFGERSVAGVATRSGEARWWKTTYMGEHKHFRSTARLRGPSGGAPGGNDRLVSLAAVDATGALTRITSDQVTVKGTRGDGSAVSITAREASTVNNLLDLLGGESCFGGGLHPATASIDADGDVVVASSSAGPSAMKVAALTIGNVDLGQPFVEATIADVVLLRNAPKGFTAAGADLLLNDYFESRGRPDYEAFIVIPVPFANRGLTTGRRRAAIHVSFRRASFMNAIWSATDRVVADPSAEAIVPNYDAQAEVLSSSMLPNRVLRAVLSQSVRVLGEVIQPINDTWYWNRGRK